VFVERPWRSVKYGRRLGLTRPAPSLKRAKERFEREMAEHRIKQAAQEAKVEDTGGAGRHRAVVGP
jgi:hypothetical protein